MKKVLLVDDNEPDRVLYRRFLGRQLGHERVDIRDAATGEEARAAFAEWQPDCVVLDYNLPDTDGLNLLADLQQLAPPSSLCVVMITGGGSEQLAVQALNAGVLDYLIKGKFDRETFCRTVTHAVEKHEWRQYESRYHGELQGINQQLRDSLRELDESRHALAVQARQLQLANEQLARSNADLDNFVYAASHDLKQPINNLQGLLAELRGTSASTDNDPEAALIWRFLDESVHNLHTLVTDLATVVREQREPATLLPPEPLALATVLAGVQATLRPQLAETQATVEADFAAVPTVSYVGSSLRTILLNVVGNALKYRDPTRRPHIRVSTRLAAGRPVLDVADNGLGIDLERHGQQLFQLFRRLHPEAASGTGVGLFLVNRLVQGQGGHIEVASQPGVGTTFSVWL